MRQIVLMECPSVPAAEGEESSYPSCWNIRSGVDTDQLSITDKVVGNLLDRVSEGNFTVGGARKTYI